MMEILIYTWEVIKAAWPVIVGIACLFAIVMMLFRPKKEEWESLDKFYDHPTAKLNEPLSMMQGSHHIMLGKKENIKMTGSPYPKDQGYHCDLCRGHSPTSTVCENPYCPDQPE